MALSNSSDAINILQNGFRDELQRIIISHGPTTSRKHNRYWYPLSNSVPATMDPLLAKIQTILSSNQIEDPKILNNIIKSLFYGLWNFDKMINQHQLSTRISELLLKIPKKNAFLFFKEMISYLHEKWSLIDKHRINKFMQLVRYLLTQAFKLCDKHKINKKKVD